jgi:hypothetical protein
MALGTLFRLALAVTRRILPDEQYDFNIAVAKKLDESGADVVFATVNKATTDPLGRLVDAPLSLIQNLGADALVYVKSKRDFYRWDPTSTVAPDPGPNQIVNPTANGANPGRFFRTNTRDPSWLQQTTWFVDPGSDNASDDNDGATALTPLAHDLERQLRWGLGSLARITAALSVTYNSSPTPSDFVNYMVTLANVGVGASGSVAITAPMTAQVVPAGGVGAFSAVQAINRAGNLVTNVTDGTRAWTRGQRIRITGSATPAHVGAIAWVQKDLTGGVAETTAFVTATAGSTAFPTAVTPSIGDTYVCETLSVVLPIGNWIVETAASAAATTCLLSVDQCELDGSGFTAQGSIVTHSAGPGIVMRSSKASGLDLIGLNNLLAIQMTSCTADLVNCTGTAWLAGGIVAGGNGTIFVLPNGSVVLDADFLASDVSLISTASSPASVLIGNAAAMRATTAVDLNPGATARQFSVFGLGNALYGSGNGTGVRVRAGAQYIYTGKPTIATTVQDALVGGTAKAWGAIPFIEPANNAMVVPFA